MSRMAMDFFAQSPVLALPIMALFLFSAVFIAIVVRAARMPALVVETESKRPLTEDHHV
jgi:hypothetical protein